MLETSSKTKLPRGWSYPVGAEGLSRALEGLPGAARQPIFFSDYNIRDTFRRQRRGEAPYQVLEVAYSTPLLPEDLEYAAARGDTEQWHVYVSPVPSEKRALVRQVLESRVLPRVRSWLEAVHIRSSQHARGRCRVLFDEVRLEFRIEESLTAFDSPREWTVECRRLTGGAG